MTEPLYSHTLGSGPDVVLLHGWGMHSGVWEDVVEGLLDHHRVTLLDLPGHGYSRASGSGHTLDDLAAAVLAIAPPRAAWVGWPGSMWYRTISILLSNGRSPRCSREPRQAVECAA